MWDLQITKSLATKIITLEVNSSHTLTKWGPSSLWFARKQQRLRPTTPTTPPQSTDCLFLFHKSRIKPQKSLSTASSLLFVTAIGSSKVEDSRKSGENMRGGEYKSKHYANKYPRNTIKQYLNFSKVEYAIFKHKSYIFVFLRTLFIIFLKVNIKGTPLHHWNLVHLKPSHIVSLFFLFSI